ncbi:MAG: type II toxin-antitoxin system RelE/ParE family toxin [Nanoarchaeota archaeon]
MTYKIQASKTFEKDFRKVDKYFQDKIKNKFKEVAEKPERYKHMHPPMNEYCRIRIEKLRILFSYDAQKNIIYLEKIVFGHKY